MSVLNETACVVVLWYHHSLYISWCVVKCWNQEMCILPGQLAQKPTIREIGIICACSDHGQPRYQIWIKCDKRQMTSCIHKMCGRTYGQTNMKRATTLAKINHPWNQQNSSKIQQKKQNIPHCQKVWNL